MITERQTNKLFLADSLPKQQKIFFQRFEKVLGECKINIHWLKNTKNIWAVDFMPVQINKDKFVQFAYNPDYLQLKKYQKTISDVDGICKEIGIVPEKSNIVVDGGNVIRGTDKVIMCDKVFSENKNIPEKDLIKQLENIFEVDKILFIPTDPYDEFGHADGMVRLLDNDTVLINKYREEDRELKSALIASLHNMKLDWIEIPYNPYENKKDIHANGIYLNFLQMKDVIVIPTYEKDEDIKTEKQFQQLFIGHTIKTVDSREVAEEGGVLNCITWNIFE